MGEAEKDLTKKDHGKRRNPRVCKKESVEHKRSDNIK